VPAVIMQGDEYFHRYIFWDVVCMGRKLKMRFYIGILSIFSFIATKP